MVRNRARPPPGRWARGLGRGDAQADEPDSQDAATSGLRTGTLCCPEAAALFERGATAAGGARTTDPTATMTKPRKSDILNAIDRLAKAEQAFIGTDFLAPV